ncbi:metallo-beta-lactamase domain-containing protein 1 [Diorhabda sublineata]|uniref:metallo-beta-lactamase domain-containing protein 1 n=1 Tax=Diorhabda sublineata TaxID=1163346 RepID=UPI0024E10D29|nr:metallo-beta-lactamase domain-containing protein 1 [Diorhabda sublineata]
MNRENMKVLFNGYSKFENGNYFANCSCVLIKTTPCIIIDTMTSWDEEKLLNALNEEGIYANDIKFVISTHGHSDHIGCNHLFKSATHIVGYSVSHRDEYFTEPDFRNNEEYVINEHVKVVPTPGHTLQDVTVLVETVDGLIAVTGDLFEKYEDLDDDCVWLNAGSDSETLQRENRRKILDIADYIVPGHGAMFKVPEKFKKN